MSFWNRLFSPRAGSRGGPPRPPARLACEQLESRLLPAAVRPDHVVVVIEENRAYSAIIGSPSAPYLNDLARQGALFSNSHAITHPSQPNYLALFSGSTQGVTDDSFPHSFSAPNLASELLAAGLTFAGYSESLPAPGFTGASSGDLYAGKHNPWVNFTNVPASANLPFAGYFPSDYSLLPTVSIVVPNLAHDMHDGSVRAGDDWLRTNLGGYVEWARSHNSLLIVTWDEDDSSENNRIPTLVLGPMVTPGVYPTSINHYSVLRTIEDRYDLAHAGASASAAGIDTIWQADNERYVQSLYVNFLGRSGSLAELDAWVAHLPSLGRSGVADQIAHSREAREHAVDGFYLRFLGRSADAGGRKDWATFLEQGATQEQVIAGFVSSPEFAGRADRLIGLADHDANFVRALYSLVLHRGPADSEVAGWVSALHAIGKNAVAASFLASGEYRADAVRSFYGDPSLQPLPFETYLPNFLERAAAPRASEVAGWTGTGWDQLRLEVAIAGSSEAFRAAQR